MIDPVHVNTILLDRLLDILEQDIIPLTEKGVGNGNKIFGAAILRKADLSLVIAETNNELENPLWHGEMHALKRFYEIPGALRPATRDCILLSTHEPCSLCLSAITWAGFDNFFYLFSHMDSRDEFAIPHDLKILKEVFRLDAGGYNMRNAFWTGFGLRSEINRLPPAEAEPRHQRIDRIKQRYQELSNAYQRGKSNNDIPLN